MKTAAPEPSAGQAQRQLEQASGRLGYRVAILIVVIGVLAWLFFG